MTTMVDRRAQHHQSRLAEHVTPTNPAVDRWVDRCADLRMLRGGISRAMAEEQGFEMMARMVGRQARFWAYLDVYSIFGIMALVALPLVFLMKKSIARKGAPAH